MTFQRIQLALTLLLLLVAGCGLVLDGVDDELPPPTPVDAGEDTAQDASHEAGGDASDGGEDGGGPGLEDGGEPDSSDDANPPDASVDGDTPPCPPGLWMCGGDCVDRVTDPTNCGGCGVDCGPGVCLEGECAATATCSDGEECTPGTSCCDGRTCVPLTSAEHCGGCDIACGPPPSEGGVGRCVEGSCTVVCLEGLIPCNGDCVAWDFECPPP